MNNQGQLIVNQTFAEFQKTKRYDFLKKVNPAWLAKTEQRIQDDKANCNSTIGEMRAYATLLSLPDYRVQPLQPSTKEKEARPDFDLENIISHSQINVEVFTVAYKPNCSTPPNEYGTSGNGFKETVVTPLMNLQTTLTNVAPGEVSVQKASIDAFGRIKDKEHQAIKGCNILYIDLEGIWGTGSEQSYPLIAFNDSLTTGVYWMAFYGEEGMPIYDKLNLNEPVSPCATMGHSGRFMAREASRFDGVLLKHYPKSDGLVFFENPKSSFPRELEDFKIALLKSGLLNLDASCFGFGNFNLMDYILMRNQWVKEFGKRAGSQKP